MDTSIVRLVLSPTPNRLGFRDPRSTAQYRLSTFRTTQRDRDRRFKKKKTDDNMFRRVLATASVAYTVYSCSRYLFRVTKEEHNFNRTSISDRKERKKVYGTYILNADRLLLFYRSWIPDGTVSLKGVVVLSHGFGEHTGRYDHVANILVAKGFAVYAMDHQGHGASEGDRAFVRRFGDYARDLLKFSRMVRERHKEVVSFYLIGHSMGGAIAVKAALTEPKLWNAVVLSGPLLEPDPKVATPALRAIARILSTVTPKLSLDPVDASAISNDPHIVNQYCNDYLVYHGGVCARLSAELLSFFEEWRSSAAQWTLPVLIQHGKEDRLCTLNGSKDFFSAVSTKDEDKKMIVYDKLKHEIYNSLLERDEKTRSNRPIEDAVSWLLSRCTKGA